MTGKCRTSDTKIWRSEGGKWRTGKWRTRFDLSANLVRSQKAENGGPENGGPILAENGGPENAGLTQLYL